MRCSCSGAWSWPNLALDIGPRRGPGCHLLWETSHSFQHPATSLVSLEPGLAATVEVYFSLQQHLHDMRAAVLAEMRDLVSEWEPLTMEWFGNLPPGLQSVYSANHTKRVTQIPVFTHLLERCSFPGLDDLRDDLNNGFAVVGKLHPGSGWLPRTDQRYANPIGLEEFSFLNRSYLEAKLPRARPDPHWQPMLDELLLDKEKGRVAGPFCVNQLWGISTVPVPGHEMIPLPDEQAHAAVCFSVTQSDKIRRCEDFRRTLVSRGTCWTYM